MVIFVTVEMVVIEIRVSIVTAAKITLDFVTPVPCVVDVWGDMVVGVLIDALADVMSGKMICVVVSGISIDALTEENADDLASMITAEIGMPTPLEKPLCCC